MALILMDLPIKASEHQTKSTEGRSLEIKVSGNAIVYKKEVREAPLEVKNDILVTHRYVPYHKQHEE